MRIDTDSLSGNDAYKLISGSIVPRPIAFLTTVDASGLVNAAPFSFFNAISGTPPRLVVSIGERAPGVPKDSGANIRATGEFVVNIVDEQLAEKMNLCATPFPPEVSEVGVVGLETKVGVHVNVPHLAASPISLECRVHRIVDLEGNTLVVGDVVCFHIRDDLYEEGRIDPVGLRPVGRLAGATYARIRDLFYIKRMSYSEWRRRPSETCSEEGPD